MPLRVVLVAAALAAAVAALAGCSGSQLSDSDAGVPRPRLHNSTPPSAAELRWIRALEYWYDVRYHAGALADCTVTFESVAGPAPTIRLRPLERRVRAACRSFERGNSLDQRAFAGEPELSGEATAVYARAQRKMAEVRLLLGAYRPREDRALPRAGGTGEDSRIHTKLSAVASALVERSVEIRCWAAGEWRRFQVSLVLGALITAGDGRAHFSTDTCARLVRLPKAGAAAGGREELEDAVALVGFAHELEHLRGSVNEALTECAALQQAAGTGVALGLSVARARALARRYWDDVYRHQPSEFVTAACRPGGPLDLDRGRAAWP